jgi:DNA-damage-inducible protein D
MSNIKLFESKKIRSHWDEKEEKWYFSVVDVVEVLTGSINPTDYLKKLRKRDTELGNYIGTNCPQVEMITTTGKYRKTLAATAENLLRIIQSVPSPKAEPFKLWLAKVGYERLEEIENPELAQERMKELYELKGYPKDWIDKRLRGIAVHQNLTEEWKKRGIESQSDFAILSAEISKATFGMTPGQYKEFKNLPEKSRANLRDHMNDLELIFTMLGERVTTEISQKEKPETFNGNKDVAKRGGTVAGNARKETEKELNRSIISKENYLELDNKLKIDTEEE